jgi:cholesterol transport system auxiliary component
MSATMMLNRRLLLMSASGLVLTGCGGILNPPPSPKLYVLNPLLPKALSGEKVNWALSVEMPDANAGLDTDRIAILRPPASMDYFADAAWPDHLVTLVQSDLVEAFESSGRIGAVAPESNAAHADYVLATELRDFEARYDQLDNAPVAVVRIDARMLKAATRDIIGHLEASQQVPAAQNSVDAVVLALNSALSGVLSQIVPWALDVPR